VPKNAHVALDWYSLAAAQDHWDAQHRLGKLLRDGRAGETEYVEAVRLFSASARGGNSFARISLGELHESGHGVPKNLVRARELYAQAAREGEPAARQKLAGLGHMPVLARTRAKPALMVALNKKP
jgi:TPR repeat protein